MRISFLGHASLLVEGEWGSLLFDPILGQTLGHGANEIYPSRKIDPNLLPPLDCLIISHRHNDHFDLESLRTIRAVSNPTVLIPDDDVLERSLNDLCYSRVLRLRPFSAHYVRDLTIITTPSSVNVPELGFMLMDEHGVVWNQVDTHFEAFLADVLNLIPQGIDVVLMPYQSGTFNEYIPLLGEVMSSSTVKSLQETAVTWRETLEAAVEMLRPKVLVPFANGLCYPAEVEVMNSLHFVDPDEALLDAVRERMPEISGRVAYPGLSIELQSHEPRMEELPPPCLDGVSRPADRLRFRPENKLSPIISPLLPSEPGSAEECLYALLVAADKCARLFSEQAVESFFHQGKRIEEATGEPVWYLNVDGLERPLHWALRWTPSPSFEHLAQCTEPGTPSMRIHANDLIGVLENRIHLYDLVFGARIRVALPKRCFVTNDNVNAMCINPAWFVLGHMPRDSHLVERLGLSDP